MFRLFKKKFQKDEAEKRSSRAERGAKLRELKMSLGWPELELLKEQTQDNALRVAIGLESTDQQRLQAASQFSTIETFFTEIENRIKAGEKAEQEIQDEKKK